MPSLTKIDMMLQAKSAGKSPEIRLQLAVLRGLHRNMTVRYKSGVDPLHFVSILVKKITGFVPKMKNHEDLFLDYDLKVFKSPDLNLSVEENLKIIKEDKSSQKKMDSKTLVLLTILHSHVAETGDNVQACRAALNFLATKTDEQTLLQLTKNPYRRLSFVRGSMEDLQKEKDKNDTLAENINKSPEKAVKIMEVDPPYTQCFKMFLMVLNGTQPKNDDLVAAIAEAMGFGFIEVKDLNLKELSVEQHKIIVILILASLRRTNSGVRPLQHYLDGIKELINGNSTKKYENLFMEMMLMKNPMIVKAPTPDDRPPHFGGPNQRPQKRKFN